MPRKMPMRENRINYTPSYALMTGTTKKSTPAMPTTKSKRRQ